MLSIALINLLCWPRLQCIVGYGVAQLLHTTFILPHDKFLHGRTNECRILITTTSKDKQEVNIDGHYSALFVKASNDPQVSRRALWRLKQFVFHLTELYETS